ncbi:hypothetical protein Adt_23318 [Abeliophyllum distichum]|uniref:Cyclin-D1-binding protein 1-like N-terminal domain-containing protein n=1 Tax=Abeliophyllum distichum TaxID=126358 RepID=A0ABD1SDA3_9LAMI
MLYTGETLEVRLLEENMVAYFNMLQGFVLLSHGSSIGAGPTLSTCIHASIKQVFDSSFMWLKEAVSSYGSHQSRTKIIPSKQNKAEQKPDTFGTTDKRIHANDSNH